AVLTVRGLRVRYASARASAADDVLRGVDLTVRAGEIVGVIGETGSGKTTLARAIVGLVEPVAGAIAFEGREIAGLRGRERRAFVLEPRLLICDEPVSALDASNRNYILRILGELRDRLDPGLIVISHDLGSLAGVADRVAVMYRGRIVEEGPIGEVFAAPRHP